jgi:hypothetical protein
MGAQTADYALTGQARGSRMKLQRVVNAAALAVQIGCVAALAVLIGFECAAWANGPMGGTTAPASPRGSGGSPGGGSGSGGGWNSQSGWGAGWGSGPGWNSSPPDTCQTPNCTNGQGTGPPWPASSAPGAPDSAQPGWNSAPAPGNAVAPPPASAPASQPTTFGGELDINGNAVFQQVMPDGSIRWFYADGTPTQDPTILGLLLGGTKAVFQNPPSLPDPVNGSTRNKLQTDTQTKIFGIQQDVQQNKCQTMDKAFSPNNQYICP